MSDTQTITLQNWELWDAGLTIWYTVDGKEKCFVATPEEAANLCKAVGPIEEYYFRKGELMVVTEKNVDGADVMVETGWEMFTMDHDNNERLIRKIVNEIENSFTHA